MKTVNVKHLLDDIEFESEAHFLAFMSAVALAKDGIMAVAVPVFSQEHADAAIELGAENLASVGIDPNSNTPESESGPLPESDQGQGGPNVSAKMVELHNKAQKASFEAAIHLLERGYEFIPVPVFNQQEGIKAAELARDNLTNQGLDPEKLPDLNVKTVH